MATVDLTPFGFTPTESLAYRTLIQRGPLGGYDLAKALTMARANAYQALNGLEVKGAVERVPGTPQRYRPVRPQALFAAIADREARQLDTLEAALQETSPPVGTSVVPISSVRSLEDLMLRTAARSKGVVECLAPCTLLEHLAPAWHKRAADGAETRLWILGDGEPQLPVRPSGRVTPDTAAPLGPVAALLTAEPIVIVATVTGSEVSGYWTDSPVLFGLTQLAVKAATA